MLSQFVLFLLFAYSVNSQYFFDCDDNYCTSKGDCPVLNCEGGRRIKNATRCGCCDICLKTLKEGDTCITSYKNSLNVAECGNGLFCSKTEGIQGKCAPSKCLQRQRWYKKEYSAANYPLTVNFECDYFGNFEPVVCIDGVLCFCVNKNGKRIFGTDFAFNNDSMKCDCSRDIDEFTREVDAEKLPRCLPNGNYDQLQCVGDKCFCMDPTHPHNGEDVDITKIKSLSCYNSERHVNEGNTKCWEEQKSLKKENLTAIAVDQIHCEVDGTYSPLKLKGKRCSCVSMTGTELDSQCSEETEDAKVTCRCLRDKEIVQNGEENTSKISSFLEINCNKPKESKAIPESFFDDFMK